MFINEIAPVLSYYNFKVEGMNEKKNINFHYGLSIKCLSHRFWN